MSDMIRFNCDTCGKQLKAPAEFSGRKVKCTCGVSCRVPGASDPTHDAAGDAGSEVTHSGLSKPKALTASSAANKPSRRLLVSLLVAGGVLATIGVISWQIWGKIQAKNDPRTEAELRAVRLLCLAHQEKHGRWPTKADDLRSFIDQVEGERVQAGFDGVADGKYTVAWDIDLTRLLRDEGIAQHSVVTSSGRIVAWTMGPVTPGSGGQFHTRAEDVKENAFSCAVAWENAALSSSSGGWVICLGADQYKGGVLKFSKAGIDNVFALPSNKRHRN